MAEPELAPLPDPIPTAPHDPPLEEARLRQRVKAELFGTTVQPTYVGRFRLLECIGQGGMGVVWSAQDDELGRTIAIKLLRPEFGGDELGAEARALARLSHPNVVGVFDVGVHEGQRFFAMEYVEGETLRAWLEREPELARIVEMFVAAGRGLAAAHAVGLVHRDFKPDNVLVASDGRARVLDFGLARVAGGAAASPPALEPDADPRATAISRAGELLGTPAYMAPEQHLGEGADARSDQFAFAVALFEATTGTLPFDGDDLRTLSLAIVRGRVAVTERLAAMPERLRRVIRRALSVDPERRYPDMAALLAELRVALHERSGGAAPGFETSEIDDVLARAVQLEAAETERPRLSLSELEDVGAEVGVSAHNIRRALARPATPGVRDDRTSELHATRSLAVRPSPRLGELLVRELQRSEGSGRAELIGASLAWSGEALDVHLDPTAFGATLALRRRTHDLPARRTWLSPVVGAAVTAAIAIPWVQVVDRPGPRDDVWIITMLIVVILAGALAAWQLMQRFHARDVTRQQRRLEYTADRLAAIVEGNAEQPRG